MEVGVVKHMSDTDIGNATRSLSASTSDAAMNTVLTTEIHDMAHGLSVIAERRRPVQQAVVHILTGVVSSLWPGARVEPYGSFATGLTSPSSDVDLLVSRVYTMYTKSQSPDSGNAPGAMAMSQMNLNKNSSEQEAARGESVRSIGVVHTSLAPSSSAAEEAQVKHFSNPATGVFSDSQEYMHYQQQANTLPFSFEMEAMIYRQFYQVLQLQDWVESCKLIAHSKVPLIKVQTGAVPMNHGYKPILSIDITIERPPSHGVPRMKLKHSAEVVRRLLNRFPAIRPLSLIIKQLLVERGLNEPFSGGLTTYGLVLMIFHVIRKQAEEVDRYNPNLGMLLLAFFRYYGNEFDPLKHGITFLNETGEFNRAETLCSGAIVVQDPVDVSNNVTGGCFGYPTIQRTFSKAAAIIQKTYVEIRDSAMTGTRSNLSSNHSKIGGSSLADNNTGNRRALPTPSKREVSMLGRMFSTRHHINVVKHASKMWCPREIQPATESTQNGRRGNSAGAGDRNEESADKNGSRRQDEKIMRKTISNKDITSVLAGNGGVGESAGVEMRLRRMEAMLTQVMRQNSSLTLENDGLRVRVASIEGQLARMIGREMIEKKPGNQ